MKIRWIILFAIFILAVINFADKSIAGLSAVYIMEDLDLTYNQWGLVGSSFYWLFSIMGVIGAILSDRFGTVKVLAIMAIIWTVAQSMALVVTSLPTLILMRILLGAGEGPFFATAVSHISKWFPPDKRGFALSILNMGNVVGKAVTAPILMAIIIAFGWRAAFFVLASMSFIWFIVWVFWLGRKQPPAEIIQKTVPVSRSISKKEIVSKLMTPTFIVTTLVLFISYSVIAYSLVFMPAFLTEVKGLSETNMSIVIAISGGIGAIIAVVLSIVSDRIFKRTESERKSRVLLAAPMLLLAGLLFMVLPLVDSMALIIVVLLFENAIIGLSFNLLPQVVNSLLPERVGTMSGVSIGFATTAGVLAPIIFGAVINSFGSNEMAGFNTSIYIIASMMVIGAIVYFFVNPDNQNKRKLNLDN